MAICAFVSVLYFATLPLSFAVFNVDAFDLLVLPIAAFVILEGTLAGLAATAGGLALLAVWAIPAGVPFYVAASPVHIAGALALVVTFGTLRRIIDRTRAQATELRQMTSSVESVLSNVPLTMWALDADGRFLMRRGSGLELLPATVRANWVGRSVRDFCREVYPEAPELLVLVERALAGVPSSATLELKGRVLNIRFSPARDAAGRAAGAVASALDITEQHEFEGEIEKHRLFDGLTGIATHALFGERLDRAILEAGADGCFAMAYFDMDRFTDYNAALGHGAGDHILKTIGGRLADTASDRESVARIDGDEFGLLLPDLCQPELVRTRVDEFLEAIRAPMLVEGRQLHVSASAGTAFYPSDGVDADALINHAAAAMREAKRTRTSVAQYRTTPDQPAGERLELLEDLREAVHAERLELHYQPIVEMATRRCVSVEALVRWRHPLRGNVPPLSFIPLAEETGLIREITFWVLSEALRRRSMWPSSGPSVAVNLSARSFQGQDLVRAIRSMTEMWAVPEGALTVELTESVVMDRPEAIAAALRELRAIGVRSSIDDYGTGYSSLAYLHRLPASELKVDRAFVGDMLKNTKSETIVRSTIELAHQLGLKVVAEGIEDQATWDAVQALGCDLAQGYFIARPMPYEQLAAWLHPAPQPTVSGAKLSWAQ